MKPEALPMLAIGDDSRLARWIRDVQKIRYWCWLVLDGERLEPGLIWPEKESE